MLKEAPIPAGRLFRAKVAMSLTVAWPSILVGLGCIAFAVQLPLGRAAAALALCLAFSLLVAVAGLCVNLLLPKLDGTNDTLVVKPVCLGILRHFSAAWAWWGWARCAGCCLAVRLAFPPSVLFLAVVVLVFSAGLWYVLNTWGPGVSPRCEEEGCMVFRTPEKQGRTVWFWVKKSGCGAGTWLRRMADVLSEYFRLSFRDRVVCDGRCWQQPHGALCGYHRRGMVANAGQRARRTTPCARARSRRVNISAKAMAFIIFIPVQMLLYG